MAARRRQTRCGGRGCRNLVEPGRFVCAECMARLAPVREEMATETRRYNNRAAVKKRSLPREIVDEVGDLT